VFNVVGNSEDLSQAISLGENIVKNTAAASFKIESNGETLRGLNVGKQFNPSKKEKGVYIQANRFRIGTSGEKQEITQKGILSNKQKRRVKTWAF
jgi:hypothetical protein